MKGLDRMELKTYLITGAGRGLGLALAKVLSEQYGKAVIGVDKFHPADGPTMGYYDTDLRSPEAIRYMCRDLAKRRVRVHVLVNCAGVNLMDWLEDISLQAYDEVMAVNARAPFLLVQGLLEDLSDGGTVCNIVSNAAHVPMTASLAYNASKGALHIMTLQMARELTKRKGITVFGIAPHKLDGTGMSRYIEERVVTVRGFTPEKAHEYQLSVMPTGRETKPEEVAEFAGWLLAEKARHSQLSGCILPYGA